MEKELRILMLEDMATDAELCERELRRAGMKFVVQRVEKREEFERALAEFRPDIILSDFSMPTAFDGLAALDLTREKAVDIPFVFVSGTIGEDRAVEAMKRGATDYVLKDRLNRLVPVVKRALQEADERLARKRSEEALRESQYRLDLALTASGLATWDWNVPTGGVRFSEQWWPILGYEPGEVPLRVEAWENLTHPDDLVGVRSALAEHFMGSTPMLDVEYRMRAKSGEWRWIRTVGRVVERDEAGRALRQTGTHGDVTERKLQQEKVARLNRILAVLSSINSAIVRIRDRQELFHEACRIAVDHGGFGMAWVSELDPVTLDVTPVAYGGAESGDFVTSKTSARADVPLGQGVVGRAIRAKDLAFVNDLAAEPEVGSAKRREAIRRGYRSVIALPLLVQGTVFGALTLYAKEPGFFDEDELKLLRELAGDISFALEYINKEEKLNYLAYYDALTGLPNRTLFIERLGRQIQAAKANERFVAAAVLDIERFTAINDTFGRHGGDALLKDLARRSREILGEETTVARIAANCFAWCLPGARDVGTVAYAAEIAVAEWTAQPFRIQDEDIRISVKCGIALYPSDAMDADALFHRAEIALRKAKDSGERLVCYAPEMNARVAEHLKVENELRIAIMQEQFVLHYQPRVDLASERVSGLEALIRWAHPERGLVPPGEFIPLLEDTGMIFEVGRWALKRAALDYAAWHAKGFKPPRVAVNVSQVQLRRKDFVEEVKSALSAAGAHADRMDIEITESMLMEDVEANIEKLRAVRALGVEIAVDDFGTGYSSLSYLARLPINSLKIDRSFISQMAQGPEQMAIVSTVISLARALNLKVVAEGVETEEQANLLRLLRCDEAQGFRFHRPLPPAEVERLIA